MIQIRSHRICHLLLSICLKEFGELTKIRLWNLGHQCFRLKWLLIQNFILKVQYRHQQTMRMDVHSLIDQVQP